jgi:murein DD-endopeptidase MepM/ murein hydrolase activator NlpD
MVVSVAMLPASTKAERAAAVTSVEPLVVGPGYYRPVISAGKAFPVARSNFLSIITINADWHAPRLRLIGGRWLLVGVHEGIDITGEQGTPILSMTPGTVEKVGWLFYSGNRVGIRGADGRYYFYAHLSSIGAGIVPGASVQAGQMLGRLGNTGYGPPNQRDEFPPHLHFGIEAGGAWVDPYATLVRLYDATVTADERAQRHLDTLAAEGRRGAWKRAAAALFAVYP